MKLRLHIDEDAMDADLVQALRLRGVDVATPHETGTRGYSDERQLEVAAAQGRALYSFNIKDYMPIHSRFLEQGKSHAGIVLAAQSRYSIGEQLRRILSLIAAKSSEDMKDQVVFLSSFR
jgi:hypothetical protein